MSQVSLTFVIIFFTRSHDLCTRSVSMRIEQLQWNQQNFSLYLPDTLWFFENYTLNLTGDRLRYIWKPFFVKSVSRLKLLGKFMVKCCFIPEKTMLADRLA